MRTLAFLGRSGSGKTTLIESLLPALSKAGLRVVVVKHAHHPDIQLEPAGKDTWRFRAAGATAVALVAPDQVFTLETRTSPPTLDEVLARLPAADLAIVESWRALALPYVEVIGDSGEPPEPAQGAICLARVRDRAPLDSSSPPIEPDASNRERSAGTVPTFARDDVARLARLVVEWTRA